MLFRLLDIVSDLKKHNPSCQFLLTRPKTNYYFCDRLKITDVGRELSESRFDLRQHGKLSKISIHCYIELPDHVAIHFWPKLRESTPTTSRGKTE